MIDEKKITEAVDAYIGYPKELGEGVETSMRRDAFKAGVEWFKNALWHERDEEPTEEGVIIKRLAKKGEVYLTFFNWVKVKDEIIESQKEYGSTQDQIALCVRIAWKECGNFDKWCYLADLLPKGGDK